MMLSIIFSFLLYISTITGVLDNGLFDYVLDESGWPVEAREEAKTVAYCESRWYPSAIGGGIYLGIFQLSPMWFDYAGLPIEMWADPIFNARAALAVYNYSGGTWRQWECQP